MVLYGREKKILEYIKNALEYDNTIEIWHVWLMDYYEYDERPVIQKCTVPFSDLTIGDIKKLIVQRFGICQTKAIQTGHHFIV